MLKLTLALFLTLVTLWSHPSLAVQLSNEQSHSLMAYSVSASPENAQQLKREHYDISKISPGENGELRLEVIMTEDQASQLRQQGLDVFRNRGQITATNRSSQRQAQVSAGGVFRPYSGANGLQQEMRELAAQYPSLTHIDVIGQSTQGTDILAIKVSSHGRFYKTKEKGQRGKLRRKPAVLYVSAQHAREWITTEVNRRLLRYFLDGYENDTQVKRLVDTTELWFVLAANPDGYDYTFTEGNRLWRKTLADNDGDGQITIVDGVDPNRNFPAFWGYDNEGSSPNPISGVYRGTGPASEPETQAYDRFVRRIKPTFLVNYHSAAELILYGVGHQVATPSPDDLILAALAGDDANPAIAGFDPDLSAELYITNGETTAHMAKTYGVLAYTPELSTCQSVSPNPESCISVFNFPDDETLIQQEFEKNLPFALDLALSAQNPFEPISHLGNTVPDFVLDDFAESHGENQLVQATISRQVRFPVLFYRVNGSGLRIARAREWQGGDRYGGDFNRYYRDVRAKIRGLESGDQVEYWFAGFQRNRGLAKSERGAFEVTANPAEVLIIANEDYDGFTPEQNSAQPMYLSYYTDALESNGTTYNVWDLDAQATPHALGVLSHYDAVIWYVGDNIITQELEDRDIFFPDSELGVHEVMQFTTIAVRDYLNEGGKLLKTGDHAGYFGPFVDNIGGLFYAANGDPTAPCLGFGCLIFSNDFHQYWLGDFERVPFGEPAGLVGINSTILDAISVTINGPGSANNAFDAGQSVVTSSVLPPAEFPAFASSRSIADYPIAGAPPFAPFNGDYYLGVIAENNQYNRFSRVIDLTGATSASLSFATSYDIENDFDFFMVEAREVGSENWTTLADTNGASIGPPTFACEFGVWTFHPFIFDHYVNISDCTTPGPTGEFHAFSGSSNGWVDASFDLGVFAGRQIEVSLAYVSDTFETNTGVFIDDLVLTIDSDEQIQGWESDQFPWSVTPAATGSPATVTEWQRSTGLVNTVLSAAVATDRTIYLPFGFEAISTPTQRYLVMQRFLSYLLAP